MAGNETPPQLTMTPSVAQQGPPVGLAADGGSDLEDQLPHDVERPSIMADKETAPKLRGSADIEDQLDQLPQQDQDVERPPYETSNAYAESMMESIREDPSDFSEDDDDDVDFLKDGCSLTSHHSDSDGLMDNSEGKDSSRHGQDRGGFMSSGRGRRQSLEKRRNSLASRRSSLGNSSISSSMNSSLSGDSSHRRFLASLSRSGNGLTSRISIKPRAVRESFVHVGTGVVPQLATNVVQGAAQVGTSVATNVAQVGTSVATNVGKGVVQGGATVAAGVGKGVVQGGAIVGHQVKEGGKKLESGVIEGIKQTKRHILGLEDYTWEELKTIEARRREILRRRNLSFFRILTFWDGTVLSALAKDPFLYVLMTLYIAIRVAARTSIPHYVAALAESDVAIIGGFLTFFLVFYSQETNNRFQHMYKLSMEAEERIFDAAALARTTLPRERALRLIRYLNAAHIAGYIGVTETYTFENFFVNENRAKGMLSPSEVERMVRMNMDNGGSCNRELCTWALHEIQLAEQQGILGARLAQFYRDLICKLRGSFGILYAYDDQPVGFFYVHFVCLLTFLYLPLFTIQTSLNAGTGDEVYWLTDVINGLIVFLQAVYVIGLRLMADRLAEPYGSDFEDLSVMYYINFAWTMSRRILEAELPGEPSLEQEEALVEEAEQSIGYPWEADAETFGGDSSGSEGSMDPSTASCLRDLELDPSRNSRLRKRNSNNPA